MLMYVIGEGKTMNVSDHLGSLYEAKSLVNFDIHIEEVGCSKGEGW
jgi:hypothetical protein